MKARSSSRVEKLNIVASVTNDDDVDGVYKDDDDVADYYDDVFRSNKFICTIYFYYGVSPGAACSAPIQNVPCHHTRHRRSFPV